VASNIWEEPSTILNGYQCLLFCFETLKGFK
jgi:hypothetical protein